jgi:hypothetical protein
MRKRIFLVLALLGSRGFARAPNPLWLISSDKGPFTDPAPPFLLRCAGGRCMN